MPTIQNARMTPRNLSVLGSLLLAVFSISSVNAENTPLRFVNDWKWEGQAAPLLLSLDKGYFAEEALDVMLDPGTGSVNAIPLVASGEYDMGSADINSLITWRADNPDVDMKAIYIIYNAPPFAVLGRPSKGVFGPLDLEGRTLGAPAFDGAYAQWPMFVAANGILEDRVNIQDVGFPVRESMLAAGDVDAITGFSFSSYITLRQNGVPEDDISLMLMSDFGLDLYGNAIIVNPDFATTHPAEVTAFLRAAIRGYQETIANPAAAIPYVTERVENADPEVELQRLVMAIGHHIVTDEVRSLGLGDVVRSRLDKSITQLDIIHEFASELSSDDIFDNSFLPAIATRQIEAFEFNATQTEFESAVKPE